VGEGEEKVKGREGKRKERLGGEEREGWRCRKGKGRKYEKIELYFRF